MTKFCGVIWVLLLMVSGMVVLFFDIHSEPDAITLSEMNSEELISQEAKVTSRKLKDDHGFYPPSIIARTKGEIVGVDDYDPIDPVPSSKTSVKHGPIQHNNPLIPYLPKPSPPDYPPSP